MSKLDIQGKLKINSSGILELNGNPYVDFNAAGQLALGNQDWLPLCGESASLSHGGSNYADAQGTASSISFDYNAGGIKFVGEGQVHIQTRIPVDKFSKYRIKIRVKKTVNAQNTITTPNAYTNRDFFYCGVSNYDSDHNHNSTDLATSYNYGVAMGLGLSTDGTATTGTSGHAGSGTAGNSDGEYVFENTISGFNLANEGDHAKFDPGTSYFNISIICNYIGIGYGNSDLTEAIKGETIIQNVEVERVSSWGTNSSDSPADTALYFSNPSQNYYPGSMGTTFDGSDWDGLVQMVGRGEWMDENTLSGSGDGRGWGFWPASGDSHPTLFIQEQKSKTATELGKPANMNIGATETGSKLISSWHVPLRVIGSYDTGELLIGNNHPVARFEQHYKIPGRLNSSGGQQVNGEYLDINIVGYDNAGTNDFSGMAIESGWGNLYFGARNIMKMSDGGTLFDPGASSSSALSGRHEWGMVIDQRNLVHIGLEGPALNEVGLYYTHGREALNLHGAVKFSSITGPKAGSGSQGKGTLWWRDDAGPGAFYYRALDGTDKVLGSGDVTFNYSGTLWEGYNADRIGTDNTVHFSKTSLNQLALNPQYYQSTSTSGMALGCGWGQSDGMNRPAIQIASAANSGWSAIYLNKVGVTGQEQSGNDTRWIQFAVNGQNDTSFRSSGSDGRDFQIITGKQISLTAADGVAISDEEHPKQVYSILDVEGSNGSFGGQLYVSSTEDFAENNGGGILFGAKVSASNRSLTGSIHGVKSNDTDGDYKGDLVFTTRSGQTGTTNDIFQNESIMPERMRIRHDGAVSIGKRLAGLQNGASARLQIMNPNSSIYYANGDGASPTIGNYAVSAVNAYDGGLVAGTMCGYQFTVYGGDHINGIPQNSVAGINLVVEEDNKAGGALTFIAAPDSSSRPESMRITSQGMVGIGTKTPFADVTAWENRSGALHIQGAQPRLRLQDDEPQDDGAWDIVNTDGKLYFQSRQFDGSGDFIDNSAWNAVTFTEVGNIEVGTQALASLGAMSSRLVVVDKQGVVGVNGSHAAGGQLCLVNNANNGGAWGIHTSADGWNAGSGGKLVFSADNDAEKNRMVITQSGNVGIGTSTPTSMLDIQTDTTDALPIKVQSMHPNQTGLRLTNGAGNTAAAWTMMSKSSGDLISPSSLTFMHGTDAPSSENEMLVLSPNGNVGIGTNNPLDKLMVAGNIKAWSESGNAGFLGSIQTGQTTIKLMTDGDSYLTGGNVGIGTTSPSTTLDVDGDINFSGNIYQNGSTVSFNTAAGGGGGSSPWADAGVNVEGGSSLSFGGYVGINTSTTPKNHLHVVGGATIESTGPVLVLKDTDGGDVNSQSGYISYRDVNEIERGYVGFGSGSTKTFTIRNNIGDVDIMSASSGGKVRLDGNEIITTANIAQYGGGGSSPWTVDGSAIGYAGTVRTQNLEIDGGVQLDNGGGTKGIWFGETSAARGYIGAGVFAINTISSSDFGISSGLGGNLVLGIAGTEKMRIDAQINTVKFLTDVEIGGELFLGPYADSAGETSSTQNKLYNISCSPFDWPESPNPDILSQISMGCEDTSQDDGVILFKTAANENQSSTVPTTGGSGDATPRSHNLVEAMRITPQGRIGIGTTNPDSPLHVQGNFKASHDTTNATIMGDFLSASGKVSSQLRMWNEDDEINVSISNDTHSYFKGGNVGIGTASPIGPLHIKNAAAQLINLTRDIDVIGLAGGASAEIAGGALAGTSPSHGGAIGFALKDTDGADAGGDTDGLIYFKTKDSGVGLTEKMRITSAGNVGIGTTSPDYGKLVVAGQWDGSGSDGVTLELNSTTEKSVIESYCRPGEGTGANAGFVGSKALEFSASEYTFIGAGVAKQHVWAKADGLPGDAGLEGAYTSYGVKTFSDTAPDYSCGVGLDTTLTSSPSFKIGFAKDSFARPIDGTLFSIRPETLPGDAKSLIQLGNFMPEFGMTEPQQQLQLAYKSGLSLFAVGGTSTQSEDNNPAWIRSFTYELPDYTTTAVYAEGNSKQGLGNPDNVNLRTAGMGVYKNAANAQAHGYHWHTDQDGAGHYYWTSTGGHLRYSTQGSHIGTDSGQVVGDQTSDERLKDIKTDFKYGLEQVLQLKPIEYSFKPEGDSQNRLGFGAQSTQDIIPEAVYDTGECIDGYDEGEKQEGHQLSQQTAKSEDTKLGMQYAQLIPVLTKAIQELKAENDDLKSRLESIEQWRGNSV